MREGRKKEASKVKQTTRQSNTAHPMYAHVFLPAHTMYSCLPGCIYMYVLELITAVSLSPFPLQLLASVGLDDNHSLNVWDWRKGKVVASTRGHSDRVSKPRLA